MNKLIYKFIIQFFLFLVVIILGIIGCQKTEEKKDTFYTESIYILNQKIIQCDNNYEVLFDENAQNKLYRDSFLIIKKSFDDISNKKIMTEQDFINLYNYKTVYKYWKICKSNPSQKKYLMGWLNRIFEP